MQTRETIVTDKDGKEAEAVVLMCPHCGCDAFSIFVINGQHQHLQCLRCLQSFCDGSCEAV